MFGLIERLRQKTEKQRRQFSFTVASVVTLVIFGLWLLSVLGDVAVEDSGVTSSVSEVDSPLVNIWQNFTAGIREIRSTVDKF